MTIRVKGLSNSVHSELSGSKLLPISALVNAALMTIYRLHGTDQILSFRSMT